MIRLYFVFCAKLNIFLVLLAAGFLIVVDSSMAIKVL